jgi:glycosyltransferase involved in cell wall biosynthesis
MGNVSPAVSVITIVRNNQELLPRAVDSVLGQGFTDFEHIIVNDGSTDGTKACIDGYAEKDQRVKPLHMAQNAGRAMARQTGVDAARGEYITFLDSDDYMPETALDDLYKVAEQDNVEIVYGRIRSFDQASGTWLSGHYTDFFIAPERHNFRLEDNLDLVDDHSIIGRLYRREMLAANKIAFSSFRKNGEDLYFAFYTAFYAKSISTVPAKTVYFYNAGNYFASANEAKIFDARDNVLDILNFVLKNGSNNLKKRMLRKAAMFAADLYRAQNVYEQKFREYLETLAPLVQYLPEDVVNDLPPYQRDFAKALIRRDFSEAYLIWKQHNQEPTVTQLAHSPEVLYNSRAWRMTSPLRKIRRVLLRLENIILKGLIGA